VPAKSLEIPRNPARKSHLVSTDVQFRSKAAHRLTGPFWGLFAKLRMRGPQYDGICQHFPFHVAPKYRQFRRHRAHEVSFEEITRQTVLGSVAMIATTQQLASFG
jgi:hypothetical protein